MKNNFLIFILLMFFSVGFVSVYAKADILPSRTIATFADPSLNSGNPLFTVNFNEKKLSGGWDKTGLILEIPYSNYTIEDGNAFENAWFEMTEVEITSSISTPWGTFGQTGHGVINFYEDGSSTDPLVVIDFNNGSISPYSLGANEMFTAENVTITGSKITGTLLQEQFSFCFANLAYLTGSNGWNDGFTATASFTSSAASLAPEPATIIILTIGSLGLIHRKKRNCLVNKKENTLANGETQMKKLITICFVVTVILAVSTGAFATPIDLSDLSAYNVYKDGRNIYNYDIPAGSGDITTISFDYSYGNMVPAENPAGAGPGFRIRRLNDDGTDSYLGSVNISASSFNFDTDYGPYSTNMSLAGVNHYEFTLNRSNGLWDLAVNGTTIIDFVALSSTTTPQPDGTDVTVGAVMTDKYFSDESMQSALNAVALGWATLNGEGTEENPYYLTGNANAGVGGTGAYRLMFCELNGATGAYVDNIVPEPATIVLLGLGALSLIRRKK